MAARTSVPVVVPRSRKDRRGGPDRRAALARRIVAATELDRQLDDAGAEPRLERTVTSAAREVDLWLDVGRDERRGGRERLWLEVIEAQVRVAEGQLDRLRELFESYQVPPRSACSAATRSVCSTNTERDRPH
jgi:hypothetical protein